MNSANADWVQVRRPSRAAIRALPRWLVAVVATVCPPAAVCSASAEEVEIGGLAATLLVPEAARSVAGAVIIAGSGPTDRNGNSRLGLKTHAYEMLADGLLARGIATLRYDKRGVGGSAAIMRPEHETTLAHFVDDAAAVAQSLAAQPRVSSVFLIGHSEGGLIALLAAARAKSAGVVLLATPGRRLGALLREQFTRPGTPGARAAEALSIIAALERGEDVGEVSQPLMPAFRPSVQPYLRSLIAVNPSDETRGLPVPVMIIGGGRDIQVGRSDFDALAAARADAVAYWDPDMGHTLKPTRPDAQSMQRAYTDPSLPLAEGLVERIADFIQARSPQ